MHQNQNKNQYSTNSLINVKYVIDLNDLRSHLNNSNNSNNSQTTKSRESLLTQQTMRTNISDYTLTAPGSVITEEPSRKQSAKAG